MKAQLAKGNGTDVGNRNAKGRVPHGVDMGMPVYVFEELRKEKPNIVADYFKLKRKLVSREKSKKFTRDASVALLSKAAGRDLFKWFNELGITVSPDKVNPLLKY